jgi:NADPH-dependent curcumin reductase CurA
MSNRQFLLVRRPVGDPKPEDFSLVTTPVPVPKPGEFVVNNLYASLDPAQRGWMDDAPSYLPPIALGAAVTATTVGRVHSSATPGFEPGDWVLGLNAIEDYSLVKPGGFTMKIDATAVPSVTNYLYAQGAVGLTAYFGLMEAGKPVAGETVLVSGAAGAVGSVVGQLAKLQGCRVIGIAGGADKCARLTRDYGFDVAIDYRGKSMAELAAAIGAAAPGGVNLIFENVGGDVLDAGLMNLAERARIILCGLISEYNSADGKVGARNVWQLIVKQATMQGFLVSGYVPQFPEGGAALMKLISAGKLRVDEHVEDGITNTYAAFMMLFSGRNRGKMILKL